MVGIGSDHPTQAAPTRNRIGDTSVTIISTESKIAHLYLLRKYAAPTAGWRRFRFLEVCDFPRCFS